MYGHSASIQRGNSRWRDNDRVLVGSIDDFAKEGGFSRSGLTGEENGAIRLIDESQNVGCGFRLYHFGVYLKPEKYKLNRVIHWRPEIKNASRNREAFCRLFLLITFFPQF